MLLGLNQVIMMAFAIVVLAALVGTGGLGQRVVDGLEKVERRSGVRTGAGDRAGGDLPRPHQHG